MPEIGAIYLKLKADADGVEQKIRETEAKQVASAERQAKAAQSAASTAAKAAQDAAAAQIAAAEKAEKAERELAQVKEQQAREAAKVQSAEAKRVAEATVSAKKAEADAAQRTAKAAKDAARAATARAKTAADAEARSVEQSEARKVKATQGAEARRQRIQEASAERSARNQERLASMGSSLTLKASLPIAAGLAAATKGAMDFEQMQGIMAQQSGASARQMALVSAKARELGADLALPATSSRDALTAMLELSKAGLDLNAVMDASRGTIQLSAAAGIENARAAEIQANALNVFRLEGNQAGKVADYLANAANRSSASLVQVADAFQSGASVAAMAGLSITEYTASLALMANAGIKGSDAGTSVKSMLMQLLSPTKEAKNALQALGVTLTDSSGRIREFPEVVKDLGAALGKLPQGKQFEVMGNLVGQDGIRALDILTRTPGELERMEVAVRKQGEAAAAAKAKNSGLKGELDKFASASDTLGTSLGTKLLPHLTKATPWATKGVDAFGKLPEPVQTSAIAVGGLVAVLGPGLSFASKIIGLRSAWVGAMTAKAATNVAAAAQERLNLAEMGGAGGKGGLARAAGAAARAIPYVAAAYAGHELGAWGNDWEGRKREERDQKTMAAYRKGGIGAARQAFTDNMWWGEAALKRGAYVEENLKRILARMDAEGRRGMDLGRRAGVEVVREREARERREAQERAKQAAEERDRRNALAAAEAYEKRLQAAAEANRTKRAQKRNTYGGSQANTVAAGHEIERTFGVHQIGGVRASARRRPLSRRAPPARST